MRVAGENGEVLDVEPLGRVVPRDPARRLVEEERQGVGIVEPHGSRAHRDRPVRVSDPAPGRDPQLNLKAIGPSANRGGGFLSNVSRSARLTSWASSARLGSSPTAARASILQRPAGPVAVILALASASEAIEHEAEIAVGDLAAGRLVVDLETRVGEGEPVERRLAPAIASAPARTRVREVQALEPGSAARQRDRRGSPRHPPPQSTASRRRRPSAEARVRRARAVAP